MRRYKCDLATAKVIETARQEFLETQPRVLLPLLEALHRANLESFEVTQLTRTTNGQVRGTAIRVECDELEPLEEFERVVSVCVDPSRDGLYRRMFAPEPQPGGRARRGRWTRGFVRTGGDTGFAREVGEGCQVVTRLHVTFPIRDLEEVVERLQDHIRRPRKN